MLAKVVIVCLLCCQNLLALLRVAQVLLLDLEECLAVGCGICFA